MEEATWSQAFSIFQEVIYPLLLLTGIPPHCPNNKTKQLLTILRTLGDFFFLGERERSLRRGVGEWEKLLLSPNGKKALKSWIKARKGDGGEELLNYKDTLLKKAQALGEGS